MAKTWREFQQERIRQVEEDGRAIPHGVLGYVHYGCRCPTCKTENAARHRAGREERRARAHEAPNHGTYSTYVNWGCQCGPCHEAGTRTLREQAAKRRAKQLNGHASSPKENMQNGHGKVGSADTLKPPADSTSVLQ